MNELQIVLILLAIIVVVVLYFFQNKNQKDDQQTVEDNKTNKARSDADIALNDLGNAHIPVSAHADPTLSSEESINHSIVPDAQLGFRFDNEDLKQPEIVGNPVAEVESSNADIDQITDVEQKRKPKHAVLKAEDVQQIAGFDEASMVDSEDVIPAFGIPKNQIISDSSSIGDLQEPQLFAIIVQGSEEFLMTQLNKTLHGVGLVLSDKGIFVKKDSMGGEIIRVANLLEPGTFTQQQLTDDALTSAGVVLILELPTTVRAPAVMHDMILMARKISQRLNGRLYDVNRQLIKESDLQKMRDQAVAYETQAI